MRSLLRTALTDLTATEAVMSRSDHRDSHAAFEEAVSSIVQACITSGEDVPLDLTHGFRSYLSGQVHREVIRRQDWNRKLVSDLLALPQLDGEPF